MPVYYPGRVAAQRKTRFGLEFRTSIYAPSTYCLYRVTLVIERSI
jgi:hypothetical protein